MRPVFGLSLILLGALWLACQIEASDAGLSKSIENDRWVRTVDGWEKTSQWRWLGRYEPALHPLVVAIFQVLITLTAFAACCSRDASKEASNAATPAATRLKVRRKRAAAGQRA